MKGAD
jgi:hypothetical protein